MAAIVQAQANQILTATLAIGGSNTIGATSPMKLRLTTGTAPTSTTAGTELSATGYTAGGTAITFATASGGSTSGPTGSAISWTNSGGTAWTGIVGVEIWDTAGTPVRWWFGTWSGQPIVIAAGNTFSVSTSAVTITCSLPRVTTWLLSVCDTPHCADSKLLVLPYIRLLSMGTTCSIEGCDRPVLARGWCSTHYRRWRTTGAVGGPEIRPIQPKSGTCPAEGCDRPVKVGGYCGGHYWRVRNKGEAGGPLKRRQTAECIVDGCYRKPCGLDLCRMHYERQRKGREIGPAEPRRRRYGEGALSYGYVITSVGGKTRAAHRRIMEELLGRELRRGETVHHVNGQRADNRIDGPLRNFRSGNLELWSSWQPAGQRVADKVEFAVTLLREYAPHLLAPEDRAA
jgi:hypothetical protein